MLEFRFTRLPVILLALAPVTFGWGADFPKIKRTLPPEGIAIPPKQQEELEKRLREVEAHLAELSPSDRPDVEIYTKAVRYALENSEFYHEREFGWAKELLKSAEARLEDLRGDRRPWTKQHGLVVRGYRSALDDSVQPYGLEIPENLDLSKPVPLYVWLHGRGDKTTDLQFIHQRQSRAGTVKPTDGIVLHPHGRYCNAFKIAGEVDVMEAIEAVSREYPVDADKVVLWGFSMGGAGVWHLAAHHPDKWVAASPGAGFAETRRYQNLKPENYPPSYEQTLWHVFDAPSYVRNLFNLPVIAYSGENDKQIQAARVMEEAFEEHGRKLPHLIGPGMGHRYHPDTLAELTEKLSRYAQAGRDNRPQSVSLQTRTLRYSKAFWVQALGLEEHWQDSRIDASVTSPNVVEVQTKNISSLSLSVPFKNAETFPRGTTVNIDGQSLKIEGSPDSIVLTKTNGKWTIGANEQSLRKTPGLQGPIDDAFMEPFLVVTPTTEGWHPQVNRWVQAELSHFQERWRRLFRGEIRQKAADQVTAKDLEDFHIIVWGDPQSNSLIAKLVDQLPIKWSKQSIAVGDKTYAADSHVPAFIYPNPLSSGKKKYVVINSGLTFREAHDRTNSLQNPKLPDWAVIDLSDPPSDTRPGRIALAGFFDESWQLRD